jgi:hypothetical protein
VGHPFFLHSISLYYDEETKEIIVEFNRPRRDADSFTALNGNLLQILFFYFLKFIFLYQ